MMKEKKFILMCFFLLLTCLGFSETTLIKNATVYLPSSTYQADSYIVINGSKIEQIGLMKELKK